MWSRVFKSIWSLAAKCLHCFWIWDLGLCWRISARFNCFKHDLLQHLCQKLLPDSRAQSKKKTQRGAVTLVGMVPCSFLSSALQHFVSLWKKTWRLSRVLFLSFSCATSGKQLVMWEWRCCVWWADKISHSSLWGICASRAKGKKEPGKVIWEALAMRWCGSRKMLATRCQGAPKQG